MSQSHEKAETFGKINSAKCWQRRALRNALSLVTAWLFWIGLLENCLPLSPKSECLHTLWPNSIAHNVYSAEIFVCLFTKTHIQVCSNSHYSIAKNWEQPKCPQKEAEDLRSVRIQRHRQAACYITSWMTLTNTVFSNRNQTPNMQTGPIHRTEGKSSFVGDRMANSHSVSACSERDAFLSHCAGGIQMWGPRSDIGCICWDLTNASVLSVERCCYKTLRYPLPGSGATLRALAKSQYQVLTAGGELCPHLCRTSQEFKGPVKLFRDAFGYNRVVFHPATSFFPGSSLWHFPQNLCF